jgi:hypothetical protein
VAVVGESGDVAGGAGVKVVGGACVHFVHTVTVEVTTVCVRVRDVVIVVLEPDVLVTVTGEDVVAV